MHFEPNFLELSDLYSSCTDDQSRVSSIARNLWAGRMDPPENKAEVGDKMDGCVQSKERTLTARFEAAPKS